MPLFILGSADRDQMERMKLARVAALFVGVWLMTLPVLAASPGVELAAFPPAGRLDYTVLREGDKIGMQRVEFLRQGDKLTVRTHADIAVTLLGITVYQFKHEAEEQWQDGQLVALTSRTDDDGKDRQVDLHVDGKRLRGIYNGTAVDLPPLIPASLWHPDTVRQSTLLDQIRARTRQIQIVDKGEENVLVKGRTVSAHHYSMTGEIKREIWYGPGGQVVQVTFPAKDGSEIKLVLR
jgi:co-chaperonin GroES (HSP10)